jgi:prepilin-type N-terminal cleavage/methylation domain-containing protein
VARRRHSEQGLTLLEIMVALAIIVMLLNLSVGAIRRARKSDLVDRTLAIAALMRRTNLAAMDTGQLHRIVFDLEKKQYVAEVCEGAKTIARNKKEEHEIDGEKVQGQLERARQRLKTPGGQATVEPTNPEDAARVAAAIAGHHVLDRVCAPARLSPSPDAKKEIILPAPEIDKVYVQHLDDVVDAGTAMVYFFPTGAAEKAVVELKDGDTLSIVVHGLNARIEVIDGALEHPEDHLMRDFKGDKDKEER